MSRGPRLLPLVAFAALCLVGLKLTGLMLGGGYVLSGVAPATAQNADAPAAPAQEPPAAQAPDTAPEPDAPKPDGAAQATVPEEVVREDGKPAPAAGPVVKPSRSEMDVLESLAERRKALEQRERELLLRENLLKAAEAKVEARIKELKAIEARVVKELGKQDEARKQQRDRLVQMYSTMKPKDAAAIFNEMDLDVLTGIIKEMSPRVTSVILAEMEPEAARRLTLELVSESAPPAPETAGDLPKIEGRGPS